jgi:ubiquinone/menaquinone biosynthesis C-methylase UbiE
VQLYGIDINAKAIKEGNAYLRQQGIANVGLFISRADELKQFGDKTIDIVFTDATLMYIGVDKIRKVIEEMKRVSCKGLLLSEWHSEDNSRPHLWYDGHWVYNYKALLAKYFYSDTITVSRHPEGLWNDEAWRKFGSIIEVRL